MTGREKPIIIPIMYSEQFIKQVESFLNETGMSPTALGYEAVRDPNFVFDIRDGKTCSLRRADKVMRCIQQKSKPKPAPRAEAS